MNDPSPLIEGAEKLVALYGQWIPFHDAHVESVHIQRVGPTVTIIFETCDMTGDDISPPVRDLQARVIIRWKGVIDLDLRGADPEERNWIHCLEFARDGDQISTVIDQMGGFHGTILARAVEVVEAVRIGPDQ